MQTPRSIISLLCATSAVTLLTLPAAAGCSGCNCDSDCMHGAWDDCHQFCNGFPLSWACKAGCNLAYVADKICCSSGSAGPAFDITAGHGGTPVIPLGEASFVTLRAGMQDATGRFVVDSRIAFGDASIVPADTLIPAGGSFDTLPWQPVGSAAYNAVGVIDIDIPSSMLPDQNGYRVRIDFRDAAGGIVETALTFAGYRCLGDADGDGDADFDDLNIVLSNWGQTVPTLGESGDVTRDGEVDFDDLNQVLTWWGDC